jgi:type II secretory ATPase GspE/PulE/Tfp pilus assembly ATPase PilB-like protein
MMVGEIRDVETARIAIQASLTGHMVFSTLHTNDAAGAIVRLVDMGIPRYLIANSVVGVLAQRLVRTICTACSDPYEPDPEMLRQLAGTEAFDGFSFKKGKGCSECMGTGHRRQTGIFELLLVTRKIRDLINQGAESADIVEAARDQGLRLLREDGLEKVLSGITTLEEVVRVTQEVEEEEEQKRRQPEPVSETPETVETS